MKKTCIKKLFAKISKLSKLQKIFLFGTSGIILIIVILIIILSISSKHPHVAFYNVSDKVQTSVIKHLNENQKSNNEKTFETIILDNTLPLSVQEKQLKKVDLLIATNDYDVQYFVNNYKRTKLLPSYYTNQMPSSTIQKLDISNHTVKYVPILYDFYELDINYSTFETTEIKNINIWADLISFAKKAEELKLSAAPFLITGADDEKLINSFGMIFEAMYGYEELQKTEDLLYSAFKKDIASTENTVLKNTLVELSKGDTTFNNTGLSLIRLRNSDILPKFYSNYVQEDFYSFMKNGFSAAAFTTLSEHRTVPGNVIKNYTSVYMPGIVANQDRQFLAPQIITVSFNKSFNSSAKFLCETKQSELSSETGLAPVQKNCSVPDKQADDVRYWLAASLGPIMPLSAAVPSEKARKYLAQFIRDNYSF